MFMHRSLIEGVVIVLCFHFTRVASGGTLDPGIPGRTMVAWLASYSLMRASIYFAFDFFATLYSRLSYIANF
jgi:hypothetical protein